MFYHHFVLQPQGNLAPAAMGLVKVQKSKKKHGDSQKKYGGKMKCSLKNPKKKKNQTCQQNKRKIPFSVGTGLHPMLLTVSLVSYKGFCGNYLTGCLFWGDPTSGDE